MTRQAGKRGRKPQKQGPARFAIPWVHELVGASVAPVYPIDVSQGITDWGMLGNDTYGDCGPAAFAHETMLAGAHPTTAEIEKLYFRYTNNQDVGVNLADFLAWLRKEGLIEAFAPVEPSTVDSMMATFDRGVLLGVSLTDDANDLFNQSKPWTTAGGEKPDPQEGHAIILVKRSAPNGNATVVTWGADQGTTGPWLKACMDEAWIFLDPEDQAVLGASAWASLIASLDALPHAVPPLTPPAPVPPTPTPVPPAPDLLEQLLADVEKKHYSAALKALLAAIVKRLS